MKTIMSRFNSKTKKNAMTVASICMAPLISASPQHLFCEVMKVCILVISLESALTPSLSSSKDTMTVALTSA